MDLSVVIVSYNVVGFLKNCLESILKYTNGIKYEIIVVDNASSDDSVEMLKKFQHDNFRVILAKENGGFAKGNNMGIKEAKGKYILLLNPDTLLLENSLKTMSDWMEAHPDVAVASCQHLNSEQKIAPTGGALPALAKVLLWAWGLDDLVPIKNSYHPKAKFYNQEFELGWVTGAFFMTRSEVVKQVGLLDGNIFMYGEEVEWCWRIKQTGWKIFFTPVTKIIHYERKSSPPAGGGKNAILGEFRGLKYLYGKHCPVWQQDALGFILDIGAFLRAVLWFFRRNFPMAKIYLEALFL